MEPALLKRITTNPHIHHGNPCIKNTRTPVYIILEALALGASREEVKADFPPLTDEDINACLMFASLLAKEEEVLLPVHRSS